MIYLDSAATTQISPEVFDEMLRFLKDNFGNPGSIYSIGRDAARAVDKARQQVAEFIGADPEQIIFTSGGSEANNLAIKGTRKYLRNKGVVVTSHIEHDSILKAVDDLPTMFVGVDNHGVVSVDDISRTLTSASCNYNCGAGLVSIMYANNETGSVNPVEKIGKLCNKTGILFHTDCVQAAGILPINVSDIGCDMLSLSSHKIHGPKGVGALFVKDKKYLSPLICGGAAQEFGLRGGTENVAGIVGFGKACEIISRGYNDISKMILNNRLLFYSELMKHLKDCGLDKITHINGDMNSASKVLNIRFENVDAETLILMLDSKHIYISAGAACRSLESKPSYVLTAMGLTPDEARDSVRISFSESNTEDELKEAARIIADCVAALRNQYGN